MAKAANLRPERWIRILSGLVFFAIWLVGAELAESRFLPTPWQVCRAIFDHISEGELQHHVGITLARVGVSFFIAMAFGTVLGMIMGSNRRWDLALDGVLVLALNIPALVVIILCYIWFGLGEFAAILAVAINKFPVVVVTMREGARAVERDLLQVARAFRIEARRTFFQIYLPQLYPYLLASARSGLALVWKIVLVVELLGRSDGVGFQLAVFFQFFDIASILAYSFAFISVVMAIELVVMAPIDRRLSEWRT